MYARMALLEWSVLTRQIGCGSRPSVDPVEIESRLWNGASAISSQTSHDPGARPGIALETVAVGQRCSVKRGGRIACFMQPLDPQPL